MKIKLTWVTEITHVKDLKYFVDEQRVGPYSMWHHEHLLIPIENGVLMRDIVTYKPPFGILGRIANGLFIKKQLKGIFDYRHRKIEELYGRYEK
jgi:ligand-binding SRPBCC domain-containing protein